MTWKSKCVYVRALTSPNDFWLWEHNSFIEQIFIKSALYARVSPKLWRYSNEYSQVCPHWDYRVACMLSLLWVFWHSQCEMKLRDSRGTPSWEPLYGRSRLAHQWSKMTSLFTKASAVVWTNWSFLVKWFKPLQTLKCWLLQRSSPSYERLRKEFLFYCWWLL